MCKINGKKIADIRTKNGMTQAQFARELGVSPSLLSKYEKGKANPTEETVDKICLLLRISKDDVEIKNIDFDPTSGESKTILRARKKNGFVRYSTPEETEKWIQNKRTVNKKDELAEVKNQLANAMRFGRKTYILIDSTMLHVPDWQRDTDMAKAMEISENYNDAKFDPVKAYEREDGYLNVADGLHRTVALIMKNASETPENKRKMLVEVLSCAEYESIMMFLGQQAGRKPMTTNCMYRAGIKAELPDYVQFRTVFVANDIQITADPHRISNPIGEVRPSSELFRMVRSNREVLYKAISLIKRLEWCGSEKNAFVMRNFSVIKRLYSNFGDEMEAKLLAHCKGAVYYESKVAPVKSNAELFDMLSAEINR